MEKQIKKPEMKILKKELEIEEKAVEDKPMPLIKQMEEIRKQNEPKKRVRKMRLPRKAKVRRSKIKKGWIGIVKIDENGNLSGEKQRLEDSTIRLKEKTYHSSDGSEIGFWEGKYPVIIQPTWRKNPLKIRQGQEKNETYGQKYIMARMIGDTIKVKAAAGAKGILYLVLAAAIGYGAYMLLTGQL